MSQAITNSVPGVAKGSQPADTMALEQRLKQQELTLKAEEAKLAKHDVARGPSAQASSQALVKRMDARGKAEGEKRVTGTGIEEADPSKKFEPKAKKGAHAIAPSSTTSKSTHHAEHQTTQHAQVATESPLHKARDSNGFERKEGPSKSWFESMGRAK